MPKRLLALLVLSISALAACGGPPPQRVAIPKADIADKQRISYRTVELREVSLPSYAAAEEIYIADESGLLNSREGLLWADDPSRAITLEISRHLAQVTGAQVASEPWPFEDRAQATVEIRVEEILAQSDGTFRLAGQYFVSTETGRDRARLFDLSVPIDGMDTVAGIAQARGQAVRNLVVEIARSGLR
ncbi:PqiC family protein [Roseovarius indicus]|uniref:PqiC family protein n=1 Tax=Roseovarius indicus TaxID=540747 RepID=UPI0007D9ED87|nr:ABC-type transport auxiliary lipoprotein family protein [Roseovarius indicus]OAO08814.1 hypothetical protein A8B76_11415 [Roseovarius indicus]